MSWECHVHCAGGGLVLCSGRVSYVANGVTLGPLSCSVLLLLSGRISGIVLLLLSGKISSKAVTLLESLIG